MKTKITLKIAILLTSAAFLMLGPSNAFAVAATTGSAAATAVANQQAKIDSLKSRGSQEIERRLTSLGTLTTKINGLKRLSADQKSQFISQVEANITDLTNLKAKITADTDLVTLKADTQYVVQSYRIYAVFIPKIHLLAATGTASEIATNLSTISDKLNTRITVAESNGSNVATLKTNLADMNTKIKEAEDLIAQVEPAIIAATPEGYPGNKTALQSARTTLTKIRQDLVTAKTDGTKIIQGLKALKNTNTNATSSGATVN